MAQWISAGRGIRYREHETRKHGKRPDRYWCLQYKLQGKTINEAVGWWSQGASQAECEDLLSKLRENWRSGHGPQTLREMRESAAVAKKEEQHQQRLQENENITLAEFWSQKYYPLLKLHKSPNSVRTEQLLFNKWIHPLADLSLRDIRKENIEMKVVRPLLEAGKSPRTVEYSLAVISQLWNMAKEYEMVSGDNPVSKIKKPRKDNQRDRFLTEEEAGLLLETLKPRAPDVHDLAVLSLFTGLRADECLSLTWADVDMDQKRIFVKDTKNTRNRHAFMTTEVEEMFRSRYQGQSAGALVFPNGNGQKNEWGVPDSFTRTVADLGLNNGIKDSRQKVVFHTLRHTFASWLVQRGVPLYNVSKLMGHRSLQMTMRYAHLAPDSQKSAAMTLNGVLTKGSKYGNGNS